MNMIDRLPAVRAGVQHHAESACVRFPDRGSDLQQFRSKRRVGVRERGHVVMVVTRDNEDMDRCFGIDVVERDNPLAFVDERRRHLTGGNLAKQATHGSIVFPSGPSRRAREDNAGGYRTCSGRAEDRRAKPDCFGTGGCKGFEFLR